MTLSYLQNKKIVLGVTGCIGAYKAAELIRLLKKEGAEVRVIMTSSAKEFITPLTLQTLSGHKIHDQLFSQEQTVDIGHISLARWADCFLIAPATANIIAKLAHGLADDLLSTTCLATTSPIFIAPAMNEAMWLNSITQENVQILLKRGYRILGPDQGDLACGESGVGRLLAPQELCEALNTFLTPKILAGKHILITAGPTLEPIDPVRFLSNRSSGKMGYAIANAAIDLGASVTLISGPTTLSKPVGLHQSIAVETAIDMYQAVMSHIEGCDIFISTAAVSDYRSEKNSEQKIKKKGNTLQLDLIRNPDILASVAALEKPPITIGCAAETEQLEKHAKEKLETKNIDMIVGNLVGGNQGFNSDENELIIFTKAGKKNHLSKKSKITLGYELMELITEYIH